LVSKNPGAVFDGSNLYMPPPNEYSQVWLQTYINEEIHNTFGGAIYVAGENVPIPVIENTSFYNNFGDAGASLSFFRGGGLFASSCSFTLDPEYREAADGFVESWSAGQGTTAGNNYKMMNKSRIIRENFTYEDGALPRKFLVDDAFLTDVIDAIANTEGQINMRGSENQIKNVGTKMVAKGLMTLEDYVRQEYDLPVKNSPYSAMIDSTFFNNVGQTSSAISIYYSSLQLLSSEALKDEPNFFKNVSPQGSTIYASNSILYAKYLGMNDNVSY